VKVQVIKTDGATSVHEITRSTAVREIQKLIGCDCCDTVNLRDGRVMFVDDRGHESRAETRGNVTTLVPVRPRKPVNPEATRLYHAICKPGTTHQIVGDVAIVLDEDFA